MPGITSFELSAHVTSPGGVTEDAIINEVKDGLYAVHFVPKELGVHTVSVKYKDIHIPGTHPLIDLINFLFYLVITLLFYRISLPIYRWSIEGSWSSLGKSWWRWFRTW